MIRIIDTDPRRLSIAFRGEMAVPQANIVVYEQIYVIEQWLRRIAYAALLTSHGEDWAEALPDTLRRNLRGRLKQLENRVHLDCENSDNVIWLLTLEQLRGVLVDSDAWPIVRSLTGFSQTILDRAIDDLRGIRNVIGHNRGVTSNTAVIAAGVAATFERGIRTFKRELLYSEGNAIYDPIPEDLDPQGDYVPTRYAILTEGNDWSTFQPMLSEGEHFYSLTHLPVRPFDRHVAVKRLLEHLEPVTKKILAVLVNLSGDEFTISWPKRSSDAVHELVIQAFFDRRAHPWTSTPYHLQSASAITDPLLWFYENARPADE